jgi:hypothetical protein
MFPEILDIYYADIDIDITYNLIICCCFVIQLPGTVPSVKRGIPILNQTNQMRLRLRSRKRRIKFQQKLHPIKTSYPATVCAQCFLTSNFEYKLLSFRFRSYRYYVALNIFHDSQFFTIYTFSGILQFSKCVLCLKTLKGFMLSKVDIRGWW